MEENPVTTVYARVEEGLTPPPGEPPPLIPLSLFARASSPPTRPLPEDIPR